jgi:glutaminase
MVTELSRYRDRGDVNRSIPRLATVDPEKFGIAVASLDGQVISAGDAAEPFSLQSISKVFTLTLAIGRLGDALWKRVGREPSGSAFNSIVQLETERGIPRNPFINAGSLVIADILLAGLRPKEAIGEIVRFAQFLANDASIRIDPEVARSEAATGFRNAALANYLRAFENLHHPAEEVLGTYVHHCAIAMSCEQLAQAGLFLANRGRNAFTGGKVVSSQRVRRINSLMLVCGQYDGSGDFAYRVGLPAKSGVGGGILAIVPGKAAIAVWSPGLNPQGNSQLGTIALERLARWAGWNVFGD